MARDLTEYRVSQTDIDQTKVESANDTLTGTAQENKQLFDALPKRIAERYNEFLDEYMAEEFPPGDAGLRYDQVDVNAICSALDCQESDITLVG